MSIKNQNLNDKTIFAQSSDETFIAENNEKTKISPEFNDGEFTNQSNEILPDDVIDGYKLGKILSESTGESVIRLCEKDNKTYAIKIYNHGREIVSELEEKLIEISKTNNIVPILFKGVYKGHSYEVIPYYKNGTVFDKRDKLDNNFLIKILIPQLNEALHAIHKNNIFHNDIKPSNIFLSDDMKSIYLGDFGISKLTHGRDIITNLGNFSRGYAAPEASRISNTKTDYYSLGVSILVLAPGNPYAGAFELEKELLSNGVTFTDNMDPNIADLICLLCQYEPNKRIGYDDVNKWIKDKTCFKGVREIKQNDNIYRELPIEKYKFKDKNGNVKFYYDGILLARALTENPSHALEHYRAGFLLDTYKNADQELGIKLNHIVDENKDNSSRGLALFVKTINNSLPLIYKDINAVDLKEYVDYVTKKYINLDASHVDHRIIGLLLNDDSIDNKTKEIWNYIISKDPEDRIDLICNFYRNDASFYRNKKKYENFGICIEKELERYFNSYEEFNLKENYSVKKFNNCINKINNLYDEFFVRNVLIQDFLENDDATINDFINSNKKNLIIKSSALYLGYLPFKLFGTQIKNLYDLTIMVTNVFVDVMNNPNGTNQDDQVTALNCFIASEIFEIICSNEENYPDDLILELNKIDLQNKAYALYCLTNKDASYRGCSTVKQLANALAINYNLNIIAKDILNDPLYKVWLKGKGVKIE